LLSKNKALNTEIEMKNSFVIILVILASACVCNAVNSKIVRQKSLEDFQNGKTKNTIISSRGTISLSNATELLAKDFNDVWTINSIVGKDDKTIFIGTSPNGKIFKYDNGKISCIYPLGKKIEPNAPKDANARTHLTNEHIFKVALDSNGNLLAAVSGEKGKLMRYNGKKFETIFEANDSPYIFAVALDRNGNIFLGTGPKGHIWRLDNKGKNPQLVYSCQDKNVLSLAISKEGFLYAGTDTRGLIYKIDIEKKTATVLYDSGENEINDLLIDPNGNLYAAATSYKSIKAQLRGTGEQKKRFSLHKSESEQTEEPTGEYENESESLKIANTPKEEGFEHKQIPSEMERGKESTASHIYKIDPNGFVTDVFSRNAVFFKMYLQKDQILLGTGNKAELFSVNPKAETESLVYEDTQASQITDIAKFGNDIVFATANPAKLMKFKSSFAQTGEFESELLDAGQPAMWGKLQIEADIPTDTKIMLSARSGNVGDVNDPTFSQWTEPVKITGPTEIAVPLARFCQYKLILSGTQNETPVIHEVAAAYVVPNLAPKITEIEISRAGKKDEPGIFKISFKPEDDNIDKLAFNIDFRKKDSKVWINIEKDYDKPTLDWDSKTVEDGIYEFKITATDKFSNTPQTALTGFKVSDAVIVDNTAPTVEKFQLKTEGKSAILTLTAVDQLSTIGSLAYTIDSNKEWNNVLPDDGVFDTSTESFTIKTGTLEPGSHIIAVKIADAEENTMYKTFEVEIKK
jgi:sugar lactone lactonase YvrE